MEVLKNFYSIKSTQAKNVKKSSILYCMLNSMKGSQCKNGKCILSMIKTPWKKKVLFHVLYVVPHVLYFRNYSLMQYGIITVL